MRSHSDATGRAARQHPHTAASALANGSVTLAGTGRVKYAASEALVPAVRRTGLRRDRFARGGCSRLCVLRLDHRRRRKLRQRLELHHGQRMPDRRRNRRRRRQSHRHLRMRNPRRLPGGQPVGRIDARSRAASAPPSSRSRRPLSKVVLEMQGAKKGLIVNSPDICRGVHSADGPVEREHSPGHLRRRVQAMSWSISTSKGRTGLRSRRIGACRACRHRRRRRSSGRRCRGRRKAASGLGSNEEARHLHSIAIGRATISLALRELKERTTWATKVASRAAR